MRRAYDWSLCKIFYLILLGVCFIVEDFKYVEEVQAKMEIPENAQQGQEEEKQPEKANSERDLGVINSSAKMSATSTPQKKENKVEVNIEEKKEAEDVNNSVAENNNTEVKEVPSEVLGTPGKEKEITDSKTQDSATKVKETSQESQGVQIPSSEDKKLTVDVPEEKLTHSPDTQDEAANLNPEVTADKTNDDVVEKEPQDSQKIDGQNVEDKEAGEEGVEEKKEQNETAGKEGEEDDDEDYIPEEEEEEYDKHKKKRDLILEQKKKKEEERFKREEAEREKERQRKKEKKKEKKQKEFEDLDEDIPDEEIENIQPLPVEREEQKIAETDSTSASEKIGLAKLVASDPYGPISGQIMSACKEAFLESFLGGEPRLVEAVYLCYLQVPMTEIGPVYDVLNKRRSTVVEEDINEMNNLTVIKAHLPVCESFGLYSEMWRKTSGAVNPQLEFDTWRIIDVDPFYIPETEEVFRLLTYFLNDYRN